MLTRRSTVCSHPQSFFKATILPSKLDSAPPLSTTPPRLDNLPPTTIRAPQPPNLDTNLLRPCKMPTLKLRISQPSTCPRADSVENGSEHSMNTTTDTTPATSFFSLPGELRNHIYELHISTYKPAWTQFTRGRLNNIWSSPLARTCRQIRNEVLSLKPQVEPQLSNADNLFAVVTDFDFTPLILLLRDAEYRDDTSNGLPNALNLLLIKRMRLHLRFTEACLDFSFGEAYDRMKKANHFADAKPLLRH